MWTSQAPHPRERGGDKGGGCSGWASGHKVGGTALLLEQGTSGRKPRLLAKGCEPCRALGVRVCLRASVLLGLRSRMWAECYLDA